MSNRRTATALLNETRLQLCLEGLLLSRIGLFFLGQVLFNGFEVALSLRRDRALTGSCASVRLSRAFLFFFVHAQ